MDWTDPKIIRLIRKNESSCTTFSISPVQIFVHMVEPPGKRTEPRAGGDLAAAGAEHYTSTFPLPSFLRHCICLAFPPPPRPPAWKCHAHYKIAGRDNNAIAMSTCAGSVRRRRRRSCQHVRVLTEWGAGCPGGAVIRPLYHHTSLKTRRWKGGLTGVCKRGPAEYDGGPFELSASFAAQRPPALAGLALGDNLVHRRRNGRHPAALQ